MVTKYKGLTLLLAAVMIAVFLIAIPAMAAAADFDAAETVNVYDENGDIVGMNSFNGALGMVGEWYTIELLTDLSDSGAPIVVDQWITIELGGHSLTNTNSGGVALETFSHEVEVFGPGTLTLVGDVVGTWTAFSIDKGVTASITGSVTGDATADFVVVVIESELTITGNVYAPHLDPDAGDEVSAVVCDAGSVEILGNIESAGRGLFVGGGGSGLVTGTINSGGEALMAWQEGTTIRLNGDANSGSHGVLAFDDATVNLYGNLQSDGIGIVCWNGSNVYVAGNVVAAGEYGVWCEVGQQDGVRVYGSEVTIDGTLTVTGPGSVFIYVGGVDKTAAEHDATTIKAGYTQWSDTQTFVDYDPATSYVWIKYEEPTPPIPPVPPTPDPVDPVLPPTGDMTSMVSIGIAVLASALGIGFGELGKRRH